MRRSALVLLGALALLSGCGGGGGSEAPASAFRGTALPDPKPSPDFALRDQDGRTVSLAEQRGRWVVVNFLYTSCPDVCPVITLHLDEALRSPEGKSAGLRVLTISVDPERDTEEAVRAFVDARRLDPGYRYLIGSEAELEPVWRDYHIAVLPGPRGTVTHTTTSVLVDPEGLQRVLWDAEVTAADVVHDLALLTETNEDTDG